MTDGMKTLFVSHEGVCVAFSSSDIEEVKAINECYGYFWTVLERQNAKVDWTVASCEITSLREAIGAGGTVSSAALFKEDGLEKIAVGTWQHYIHSIQGVACLTSFDTESNTIRFLHEGVVSEHSYIRNLVREPILAKYKKAGHTAMHASACAVGGEGILMPGFKGAGKSTLVSHLLTEGADFIANDAVLCEREGEAIFLTTYPQCVRLSRETIGNNPVLSAFFRKADSHRFILNKFEFLPDVLDQMLPGHRLSHRVPLAVILLPALDLTRTDHAIDTDLDGIDLSVLEKSQFYQYHNYTWSPFFEELNDPSIDAANFAAVFGTLPRVCRLRYGILDDEGRRKLFRDVSNLVGAG